MKKIKEFFGDVAISIHIAAIIIGVGCAWFGYLIMAFTIAALISIK